MKPRIKADPVRRRQASGMNLSRRDNAAMAMANMIEQRASIVRMPGS
jgi:hypothetical protein